MDVKGPRKTGVVSTGFAIPALAAFAIVTVPIAEILQACVMGVINGILSDFDITYI